MNAPRQSITQKQFLDGLAAYAAAQIEVLDRECVGFSTDTKEQAKRVKQAQSDFAYFSRTYFPHYVKSDASAFHQWVFETLPTKLGTGTKLKISAPRGEAKSTLVTRLLCLWCVVTDRKHYMPIIMDAFDQAAQMLESIKVELDSNPRLLSDFPKATGQGRVWNAGVIVTANNIKIQAYGSGKRMRGATHGPYRPDLVFLDDIENDENVRSKEQRDKLDGWLKKVVLPLGPPDGSMDVIYLSTVLHYDSVANRTHRLPTWQSVKFKAIIQWPNRMDLWDKWEEFLVNLGPEAASDFYKGHKGQMDAGAIVSWPSQRPLVRLMSIRADDHRAFEHEYQNDPSNDDSAPFKQITFWVHQENDWVFYGACDPSLGKSNKSRDPSAILVGGWSRARGVLSVVESKIARMLPTLQI